MSAFTTKIWDQGVDYRLFAVDDCWGGYAGKPGTGGKYDFAAVEDYCQRIEHTGDRFVPVESWCRTTYGRCQETDVI